ncbi:MAG TPA: acetyl-CoA carboxylase biotin carboxyl carrier protein subunit [Eggerthellaceae bacterium]|nr:acetyl-CoA carboxylase biotin carboxyl carrier protein subunit [Eggerthellaceae bacterium]
MKYVVTIKDRTYEVEVEHGEAMVLDEYEAKAPAAAAPAAAPVAAAPAAAPAPAAAAPAAVASGTTVEAPLPGNVLSIKVKEGDAVKEGDVLLLIEAMKMENEVAAPCDGAVKQIVVSVGQMVSTGDALVVI